MELVTPSLGLIFWTTLVFLVLVFLLKKFVWKQVISQIKDRQEGIEEALQKAQQARDQVENLEEEHRALKIELQEERKSLLVEARATAANIIEESKEKSQSMATALIEDAKAKIDSDRVALKSEVEKYVLDTSLLVAEKIIRKQLKSDQDHKKFINLALEEMSQGSNSPK